MVQKTKYTMVKEQIASWIDSGKVNPGEKIYSENELVNMFNVSRHTVRQAVGDLVHEGLLYREQGAGTFVAHASTPTAIGHSVVPMAKPTKNIGVITTYITDYIFPTIIKGIESHLTEQGYSLTFSCTDNDVEKEKQCLQAMLQRQIDGLIVEPTKSSSYNPNIHYYLQLERNNVPYLMINQFYSQLTPPHIIVNDEQGGFLATDHLLELGHTEIVGLFKTDDLQGVNRMQGFIRAFRERKRSFRPEMIVTYATEDMATRPLEQIEQFFTASERPTAIVCYNDQLAINVLHILRKLNLRVPDDVSLVGYDDSFLAEATEVKLTTVVHPKTEMGAEAAKWIIAAIEQQEQPPSKVYEPELIVRQSTKRL